MRSKEINSLVQNDLACRGLTVKSIMSWVHNTWKARDKCKVKRREVCRSQALSDVVNVIHCTNAVEWWGSIYTWNVNIS